MRCYSNKYRLFPITANRCVKYVDSVGSVLQAVLAGFRLGGTQMAVKSGLSWEGTFAQ
jgi:hypothetical protein